MPRVQKLLAQAGIASRRHAEELIVAGRVQVNGKVATLGESAETTDRITVDGKAITFPSEQHTYMLYKPRGYITSNNDEHDRKTVFDLLPAVPGLHSVGRLDYASEGLLILTTDGNLTLQLTHPRFAHEKEYRVWFEGELTAQALKTLRSGVELEDGITQPAQVTPLDDGAFVVLKEGKNRQVRRMFEAVGCTVQRLARIRLGGICLRGLRVGQYRALTEKEIGLLMMLSAHPKAVEDLHEAWNGVQLRSGKGHDRALQREESPGITGQNAMLTAGRRASEPQQQPWRRAKPMESATETRPPKRDKKRW